LPTTSFLQNKKFAQIVIYQQRKSLNIQLPHRFVTNLPSVATVRMRIVQNAFQLQQYHTKQSQAPKLLSSPKLLKLPKLPKRITLSEPCHKAEFYKYSTRPSKFVSVMVIQTLFRSENPQLYASITQKETSQSKQ